MKNTIVFPLLPQSFFMIVLVFFPSCNDRDGFAIAPDFLKKEWMLTGDEQNIRLTAKNNVNWVLSGLSINGEFFLDPENKNGDGRIVTYSSKEEHPDYPHIRHNAIYKIEFEDWFAWEKFGNAEIKIRLAKNESGKNREIRFLARAGNGMDNIHIVQKTK